MNSANFVLSGAIILAYGVAGLFFLRFWKKAHDRLFLFFALGFWALGLERVMLVVVDPANEIRPYFYLLRLIAFLLIIAAIIEKNRGEKA